MSGGVIIVDLSRRLGGTQRRIASLLGVADPEPTMSIITLADAVAEVPDRSVERVIVDRARWDPRLLVDLVGAFRRLRPEVVDAHNVTAQFWSPIAARLTGVPRIVCTVHSDYAAEHAESRRSRWYPRVLRLASVLGARFIAVDSSVALFLRALGVPERAIVVVPNAGVELTAGVEDRQVVRSTLGVGDEFVVLFAGRLEPVKDVGSLIEAFARPDLVATDARLWIAGDGSQRTALADLASDLHIAERVHFLGAVDDVVPYMDAADCLALVSRSEGLPYVVLEAAELSLPMMLTRVGSLVDLLGEDGACFVEAGDVAVIADALAHLAREPSHREELATRARQRVRDRLSVVGMRDATMAFYEEPANRRSAVRTLIDAIGRPARGATFRLIGVASEPLAVRHRLDVLTYHRVGTDASDSTLDPILRSASPEAFDEQMSMIRSRFHPLSIDEVALAVDGAMEPPPGSVLVTFDDAYEDLWTHALPTLLRYAIPAVVFVPTAYPDSPELDFWWDRLYRALLRTRLTTVTTPVGVFVLDGTPARASVVANAVARFVKSIPHAEAMATVHSVIDAAGGAESVNAVMSWNQLTELASYGVMLESHTRTHAALDQLDESQLSSELDGSMDDIERRVGRRPIALAYPTGQSSSAVLEATRSAGFSAGFTTRLGRNRLPVVDRLQLSRLDVSRSVDATDLRVLLGPLGGPLQRIR